MPRGGGAEVPGGGGYQNADLTPQELATKTNKETLKRSHPR